MTVSDLVKAALGANLAGCASLAWGGPRDMLGRFRRSFELCWYVPCADEKAAGADLSVIPEVSLDCLLCERVPVIRMAVGKTDPGALPPAQVECILAILVDRKPKVVVEIGTFMGSTTRQIALSLPEAIVHTVDLPEGDDAKKHVGDLRKDDFHLIDARVVGRDFRGTEVESRIRQHLCDTAVWAFEEVAGAEAFFIDGSHTYDYCRNDSEKCLAVAGDGAVIMWHDCDVVHPGVVKLLREWREMGRDIVRVAGTPVAYWKVPKKSGSH